MRKEEEREGARAKPKIIKAAKLRPTLCKYLRCCGFQVVPSGQKCTKSRKTEEGDRGREPEGVYSESGVRGGGRRSSSEGRLEIGPIAAPPPPPSWQTLTHERERARVRSASPGAR